MKFRVRRLAGPKGSVNLMPPTAEDLMLPAEDPALFLAACDAHGPLHLEWKRVDEDGPTMRSTFSQPSILIGRSQDADLILDHEDVSHRHVYLQVIAGRLYGLDLDSRSGIFPSSESSLDAPGWLSPDEPFRVGPYLIRVSLPGASAQDLDLSDAEGNTEHWDNPRSSQFATLHPGRTATLEVVDHPSGSAACSIRYVLTLIGRSSQCKIRTTHPGASMFYGALLSTKSGIWGIDLLSGTSLLVNGRRVRFARLKDGDEVQIRHHKLRFRYHPASADRPEAANALADAPKSGPTFPGPKMPPALAPLNRPPASPDSDLTVARLDQSPEQLLQNMVQMQQQMSDQFQQTLMMITKLFGTMHQDHMGMVREELSQIRRLTEQMQALQTEAKNPAAGAADPPSRVVGPEPNEPDVGLGIADGTMPEALDLPAYRDPKEIQAMVAERLANFEQEREARWKKLVKVLAGQ